MLFLDSKASETLDHSSVDASRSVGFKVWQLVTGTESKLFSHQDTNLFCVAPVLSPDLSLWPCTTESLMMFYYHCSKLLFILI